ncbi:MAG: SNF2-related protein [Planctomycetota bacterium]|nr:SNF2-related protein [Planctomycetota bacterium]
MVTALAHNVALVETGWEPGDRLAVHRTSANRLKLPEPLLSGELEFQSLVDPSGMPVPFRRDKDRGEIVCAALKTLAPDLRSAIWFEYRAPGQYAVAITPAAEPLTEAEWITDRGVHFTLAGQEDGALLIGAAPSTAGLAAFQLALRAARLGTHAGFDQLISLPLVRDMELLDHQIRTAKTVLRRFRGRALLCDEVGLGKTIEAGLVLSELHLRGLVRSVLVLVPPSLIEQWQGELRRKFSLDFVTHDEPAFRERGPAAWAEYDRVIVSTHTAKREPHRAAILARRWDLVIVDEAHHLRNRSTQLWKFASELQKQFMLLLTATPVQNNLDELFNLVTLLEPGLLSTAKQFQRQFVDRRDKLTPRNVGQLHELLAEVMVRNRRSTVGLQFTRRWAKTLRVTLAPPEQSLYHRVTQLVRQHLRSAERHGGLSRMALLTLQMALGSSPAAAAGTLETMAANPRLDAGLSGQLLDLADEARTQTAHGKLEQLLTLLHEFPDKMVIFTQFRATQALLSRHLAAAGHELAVFHGGLSRLEKEAAIAHFRGPARLLLCTESGSEGRNLQFAHAVCNFDLPWNPMRIEQRIGRLSRIGQTHDVHVFNLVAADTVEAAVLHLLDAKLSMFELVIGEIDMILGNLDEEREFQDVVADVWAAADDDQEFAQRMEELGDRLVAAKQAYLTQRAQDDRMFGARFAPDA